MAAVSSSLVKILSIRDSHGIVQITSIQSCLVLIDYFSRKRFNLRYEAMVIKQKSYGPLLKESLEWCERASMYFRTT
jgi:hypothetical protein